MSIFTWFLQGYYLPTSKGGFKSEETGEVFRCQNKYSKSLSWAENLNFLPKTVNNLFKFSAQDSDLEYLFWQRKNSSVSSDLKQPLKVSYFKNAFLVSSISSKKQTKTSHIVVKINSFVLFWKNLRLDNLLSKLTDLYSCKNKHSKNRAFKPTMLEIHFDYFICLSDML